jgi:hypothetical protein
MYHAEFGNGDRPLIQRLRIAPIGLLVFGATSACQASQSDVRGAETSQQPAANSAASRPVAADHTGNNVTNEQAPINQRFRSLDEYLAYLERMEGPVDGPWYKEVSPGIYQLQTGNLHLDVPGGEKRTFTRQELAEKFGFSN